MQKSDNISELAKALAKVQSTIKPAIKDSNNPFFKSKYADLTSVWDACSEALAANGLSVAQVGEVVDGKAALTTVLMHESGQWISGTMEAPLAKQDAQAVGSCITYLRRYGLAAVVGIRTEDDDGAAASGTVTIGVPEDNAAANAASVPTPGTISRYRR